MHITGNIGPGRFIYDATTGALLGYRNPVTGDDVGLPHEMVVALASASGVVAVDLNRAQHFTLALTEAVTGWTFANYPASGMARRISVRITQHAVEAVTVAWPASFQWAGGSEGAVSVGLEDVDVLDLITHDNGVTWNASIAKAFAVPA